MKIIRQKATAYQDYCYDEESRVYWWEWTSLGAEINNRHAAHPFGDGRAYKAGDIVQSRITPEFKAWHKLLPTDCLGNR